MEASVTRCCRYTSRTQEFFAKRCGAHLDFSGLGSNVRLKLPSAELNGPWDLEDSVYENDSLAEVDLGAGVHVLRYGIDHRDLEYGGSSSTVWTFYAFDGVAPTPILEREVAGTNGPLSAVDTFTWLARRNQVADLSIATLDAGENGLSEWQVSLRFQDGKYRELGEPKQLK